jgi:hypothetical protein
MAARKRHRGRYCWVCCRTRPKKMFSGQSHAGQICKHCAGVGTLKLGWRKAIRNLNELMDYGTRIPRKKRRQFNQYLIHPNERVRAYALEIETADALERAEFRAWCDLDEVFHELVMDGVLVPVVGEEWQVEGGEWRNDNPLTGTEIPF